MPLRPNPAASSPQVLEVHAGEPATPNTDRKQAETMQADAQDLPSTATVIEEAEILHASIRSGSVAQIVVAGIAVIGLLYLLKVVMVTTLVAMLLAFVVEPLVDWLARIRIPRPAGALIAVALMLFLAGNLTFFFYNRAVDFAVALPQYSGKIRDTLATFRAQTTKIEESTRSVLASPKADKQPLPVEVQEAPALSRVISAGTGTLGEVVLAISFVPFLVYFMLTWKDHMLSATVRLFPKEHRLVAHRTVGRISAMIRSFIVGNVLIGVMCAAVSTAVFWYLGLPYFYFLGVISGFMSLIPYLGVFLALLPPLAAGFGIVDKTGFLIIVLSVIGLHLLTMNALYPKIVGKRLRLNPLVVTLALFFWAWIWGAMGLILAVPLVGATKIICDYVDSLRGFGAWLGE
jgi:predicted PurR-regulated permease PerM